MFCVCPQVLVPPSSGETSETFPANTAEVLKRGAAENAEERREAKFCVLSVYVFQELLLNIVALRFVRGIQFANAIYKLVEVTRCSFASICRCSALNCSCCSMVALFFELVSNSYKLPILPPGNCFDSSNRFRIIFLADEIESSRDSKSNCVVVHNCCRDAARFA